MSKLTQLVSEIAMVRGELLHTPRHKVRDRVILTKRLQTLLERFRAFGKRYPMVKVEVSYTDDIIIMDETLYFIDISVEDAETYVRALITNKKWRELKIVASTFKNSSQLISP